MSIFAPDELVTLTAASVPPRAVSIHLPMHRAVPETFQDPVRCVTLIIPAARHGRVEVLFAARTARQWGTYDPGADRDRLLPEADPGGQDLLEPARTPEPASLTAIFRYRAG